MQEDAFKTQARVVRFRARHSHLIFHPLEGLVKPQQQRIGLGIGHARKGEMKDRECFPLRFEALDGQPLKEVFPPFKISFERADEQALAEAPRPRQEVLLALCDEPIQDRRLIRIEVTPCADCFEVLDADGQ